MWPEHHCGESSGSGGCLRWASQAGCWEKVITSSEIRNLAVSFRYCLSKMSYEDSRHWLREIRFCQLLKRRSR
jgi:hypothetical protein